MTRDRRRDDTTDANDANGERLRALLRRGDPAADGREPAGEELRALRDRTLRAAREGNRTDRASPAWRRRPALTAAVVGSALAGALVVGLALWTPRPGGPEAADPTAVDPAGPSMHEPATRPDRPRQVHFTAPGGTRIVWTLYPEAEALATGGGPPGRADGTETDRRTEGRGTT